MDSTQSIGDVNELMCLADFIKRGYVCSIPYGNSAKYDFIVQKENQFFKIQCKSSHITNDHNRENKNAFTFCTIRQTTNTKETKKYRYTKEEVDYFATNYQGVTYVIPLKHCSSSKTLWLTEPPHKTCSKASDYIIDLYFPNIVSISNKREQYIEDLQQSKIQLYCKDCGKPISDGERCPECASISRRKVDRPERDIFKQEIRKYSFKELGRKYTVSDKTISKWCAFYKLPSKKSDIIKISEEDWINI